VKKAVMALLAGVVITAGGVGLYVWLDQPSERDRAEEAADEFAVYFGRAGGGKCEASKLEPLADEGAWRFHLDCGRGSRCLALDLDEFTTIPPGMHVAGSVEGVTNSPCGPESWTASEAGERLQKSEWASERQAKFISCTPRGENPYAAYASRFGCRYSTPQGDGFVVIRATGADSFEVESSE
jgi:hypothetical protein